MVADCFLSVLGALSLSLALCLSVSLYLSPHVFASRSLALALSLARALSLSRGVGGVSSYLSTRLHTRGDVGHLSNPRLSLQMLYTTLSQPFQYAPQQQVNPRLPKPHTLNRKPQTLSRKPHTLNRKPHTLNRKPHTLNRKPTP